MLSSQLMAKEFFVSHKFRISAEVSGLIQTENIYEELKEAKTILDSYYTRPEGVDKTFSQVMNLYDPFRSFKYRIAQNYHGQNVNNIWLKFWEMISEFKLIPGSLSNESFITFDNAALPGSGILAINHWVKSMTNIKSHVWYAYAEPGEDNYDLIKSYPHQWLTAGDGSMTKLENILKIRSGLEGSVHLYTSDLGFDSVEDYNAQETKHAHSNLGQLLLGLHLLRLGGSLITKMYTFQIPFTQSLVVYCSKFFEKFYIYKPASSRVTNSECYLVGVNFLGIKTDDTAILEERMKNFNLDPLTDDFPENLSVFQDAAKAIYSLQILSLRQVKNIYDSRPLDQEEEELYIKSLKNTSRIIHNQVLTEWLVSHPVRSLRHKDKLASTERIADKPSK